MTREEFKEKKLKQLGDSSLSPLMRTIFSELIDETWKEAVDDVENHTSADKK